MTTTITPSRAELGQRCDRRHLLNDVFRYAKFYSPSLEGGSVIHAGAGAWWANGGIEGTLARREAMKAIEQEYHKRFEMNPRIDPDSFSKELALAMMDGYTQLAEFSAGYSGNWGLIAREDRLELSVKSIYERLFEPKGIGYSLPNSESIILSWKCDRLLHREEDGLGLVVDTKTAGRFDKRWEAAWARSLQMKLYKVMVLATFGLDDVDVVIEGVLKKVPSEVRYVTCPSWSLEVLWEALVQAYRIAVRDSVVIERENPLEAAVRDANFNYGDCFSYGSECQFMKVCLADPDERTSIIRSEYFELPEEDE